MALPTTSSARGHTIEEQADGGSQLNDLLEKLNKSSHMMMAENQMPQMQFQLVTPLSDGNYISKDKQPKTFTDQLIMSQKQIVGNAKNVDSPIKKTWSKTPSNVGNNNGQQARMETT
jgi:hypothetical protein